MGWVCMCFEYCKGHNREVNALSYCNFVHCCIALYYRQFLLCSRFSVVSWVLLYYFSAMCNVVKAREEVLYDFDLIVLYFNFYCLLYC